MIASAASLLQRLTSTGRTVSLERFPKSSSTSCIQEAFRIGWLSRLAFARRQTGYPARLAAQLIQGNRRGAMLKLPLLPSIHQDAFEADRVNAELKYATRREQ